MKFGFINRGRHGDASSRPSTGWNTGTRTVLPARRQALAAMREEDLLLLGVRPGHARRIVARVAGLLGVIRE